MLLVDADLGGANLHTLLGIQPPQRSISDFIDRRVESLHELAVPTPMPGLKLISGASDTFEGANPKYTQKQRLLNKLRAAAGDILLLDLGAGTGFTTLDFFNLANVGVLVLLPEPTSIENGYRFLRAALLRRLRHISTHDAYQKLIDRAYDPRHDTTHRHLQAIAERAAQIDDKLGEAVARTADQFEPRVVLNQVRSEEDVRIGHGLRLACHKMLGLRVRFQGAIPYDDTVWQAIRKRTTHLLEYPESLSAIAVQQLADRMDDQGQLSMAF